MPPPPHHQRPLLTHASNAHNFQRRLFSTLHHSERSETDIQFVCDYLTSELLFVQELPESAKRAIATHAICQHVRPGTPLIKHNDNALALYLIWSGSGTIFRSNADTHRASFHSNADTHHDNTAFTRQTRLYGSETLTVVKGDTFGEEGLCKRLDRYNGDVTRKSSIESPSKTTVFSGHEVVPNGEAAITVVAHPVQGMVVFVIDFLEFTKHLYPLRSTLCFTPSHCIHILGIDPLDRTAEDLETVHRFVARIPFFQQLSKHHQLELCRVMKHESHYLTKESETIVAGSNLSRSGSNSIIFQEGWKGESFYVIVSGVVSVHQKSLQQKKEEKEEEEKEEKELDQKHSPLLPTSAATDVAHRFHTHAPSFGPAVAELRHGDSFGEQALHGEHLVRNATIICQSKLVMLMTVDRESYNKIIKPRRTGIVMNVASAMRSIKKRPHDRTENDVDVLMPLVGNLSFFKQLPNRVVRHLVQKITMVEVAPQRIICEQGTEGNTLHIILSGSCAVFQCDEESKKRRGASAVVTWASGPISKKRMSDSDWGVDKEMATTNPLWVRPPTTTTTTTTTGTLGETKKKEETTEEEQEQEEQEEQKEQSNVQYSYPQAIAHSQWYGDCVINLLPGDSFGEKSVITNEKRNATVITREQTRMFVLEKEHYDVIAKLGHVISNPSNCISALSKIPSNRTSRDIHDIFGLFSQMTFFRQLPGTSSCSCMFVFMEFNGVSIEMTNCIYFC